VYLYGHVLLPTTRISISLHLEPIVVLVKFRRVGARLDGFVCHNKHDICTAHMVLLRYIHHASVSMHGPCIGSVIVLYYLPLACTSLQCLSLSLTNTMDFSVSYLSRTASYVRLELNSTNNYQLPVQKLEQN
jgi:hypothetical protein